jgi:hypothetical protein
MSAWLCLRGLTLLLLHMSLYAVLGVFSKDCMSQARVFNEDDQQRRHAVLLSVAFPKTFHKSSLGLGLTENQLQLRYVQ